MGFVDGLFEMYKLREGIAKAQVELISNLVILFGNHMDDKSFLIKYLIAPKIP